MIKVNEMEAEEAMKLWPDLEEYVAAALEHDPYISVTVAEVEQQLSKGYARLLVTTDDNEILGATVVQMFRAGAGRVIHVLTTAGVELDRWLSDLVDAVEALAQANNGVAITMSGRPGWTRTLRKFGFKTQHVQMRREVSSGISREVREPTAIAG